MGRPIDMQAQIRDAAGKAVPHGRPGYLYLKGDNLFDGYEDAGAFEAAPLNDGWFCAADLAIQTRGGSFQILGRADEARNLGGVLVHPAEINSAPSRLPYVEASKTAFLTSSGTLYADTPVSFIQTQFALTLEQVKRDLDGFLPPSRMPREIVRVEALPLTEVGKADRQELLRLHAKRAQATATGAASLSIDDQIVALAARVLGLSPDVLSVSNSQDTTIGWDSFGHINLALEIERHFGIRLSYANVTGARSLADFAMFVKRKTGREP